MQQEVKLALDLLEKLSTSAGRGAERAVAIIGAAAATAASQNRSIKSLKVDWKTQLDELCPVIEMEFSNADFETNYTG